VREDQETFLIVLQDPSNGYVQAFLQTCRYEELPALNHDCWNLHVYLLMPEPQQAWTGYGTQLAHVIDFKCVHAASQLTAHAAWHLSRLPVPQRRLELERIRRKLDQELIEAKPLTEEEVQTIRRFGSSVPDFEPVPDDDPKTDLD
jgi:hypothetical protein